MIFERAADEMDAVGEQCRGQRIAFEAAEGLAVEGEARGLGGRQPAGAGNAERFGHHASFFLAGARLAGFLTLSWSGGRLA